MLLDDISSLLEDAGIDADRILATSQVSIPTKGELPAEGILHLRQYGGLVPERTQNAAIRDGDGVVTGAVPAWQRPNVQVSAFAPDYETALQLAYAAYYATVGVRNRDINGVRYREIDAIQEPFDAGPDGNEHAKVVFNLRVIKRPSL